MDPRYVLFATLIGMIYVVGTAAPAPYATAFEDDALAEGGEEISDLVGLERRERRSVDAVGDDVGLVAPRPIDATMDAATVHEFLELVAAQRGATVAQLMQRTGLTTDGVAERLSQVPLSELIDFLHPRKEEGAVAKRS